MWVIPTVTNKSFFLSTDMNSAPNISVKHNLIIFSSYVESKMKYFLLQTLHISNAMQKLGVKGRSQAVVELLRMGELEL